MSPTEKLLYTPTEAAERLAKSRSQLYREIQAGRIRTVRDGSRLRLTASALQDYVRSLETSEPCLLYTSPSPRDS